MVEYVVAIVVDTLGIKITFAKVRLVKYTRNKGP